MDEIPAPESDIGPDNRAADFAWLFPVLTPELAAYAHSRGVAFYSFTEPEIRGVIDFAEANGLTVTEAMVAMVGIVRAEGMEANLTLLGD